MRNGKKILTGCLLAIAVSTLMVGCGICFRVSQIEKSHHLVHEYEGNQCEDQPHVESQLNGNLSVSMSFFSVTTANALGDLYLSAHSGNG